MESRTLKTKRIIFKTLIILLSAFLTLWALLYIVGNGIDKGKKEAKYIFMCNDVQAWKDAGSPRGEDLEKWLKTRGGFSIGENHYPMYVASNLVFKIRGTNVTTLFATTPTSAADYVTFITEDCLLIELWPSGNVRVIKDSRHPPVGPPLSRFSPFFLPSSDE